MVGRVERAALMAPCTSRAAPSMSRSRSNCKITLLDPRLLEEVISVTPAMRPKARSSGVATVAAMVSGLAPGMRACTTTTGKSISGRGATGSRPKATMPARAMAMVRRVVATGRRMKGAEIFRGMNSGPKRWRFSAPVPRASPGALMRLPPQAARLTWRHGADAGSCGQTRGR